MSDVNEWLKERRRIHDAATGGPWETNSNDEAWAIQEASNGQLLTWDDHGGEVFRGNDSAAIVDAHNTLPALLTAVERVLEQAEFMETDAEAMHHQGQGHAYTVLLDYAQVLREAIEGAIK